MGHVFLGRCIRVERNRVVLAHRAGLRASCSSVRYHSVALYYGIGCIEMKSVNSNFSSF